MGKSLVAGVLRGSPFIIRSLAGGPARIVRAGTSQRCENRLRRFLPFRKGCSETYEEGAVRHDCRRWRRGKTLRNQRLFSTVCPADRINPAPSWQDRTPCSSGTIPPLHQSTLLQLGGLSSF